MYVVGIKEVKAGYHIAKVFESGVPDDYEVTKIFIDKDFAQNYADLLNEYEMNKIIDELYDVIDYNKDGEWYVE